MAPPTRQAAPAAPPGAPQPLVSQEKADLHLCAVRLPMDKARSELGYAPIVDFETACRHALAWLAFAGYPVEDGAGGRDADSSEPLQRKPQHGG